MMAVMYFQAVIIAWTSDFVPRMVYIFGYSSDWTLDGYVNNSMSLFNTDNYTADTKPSIPGEGFENLDQCRYDIITL